MRSSRVVAGTLIGGVVVLAILLALREAGDFERISGIADRGSGDEEATLRGTGVDASTRGDAVKPVLRVEGEDAGDGGDRSWTLRGRVVDLHHQPVAGVAIQTGKDGPAGVTSGADGTFTFRTTRDTVTCDTEADGLDGFSRTATRAHPDITLQVVRLLSLDMTILDVAGQPAAGLSGKAVHTYTSAMTGDGGQTVTGGASVFGPTDETGRCVLRLPESTAYVRLDAARAGAFARERVDFPLRREVVLRLRPRLLIRGEIVDETGASVEPDGRLVARPLDPTQSTILDPDHGWRVDAEIPFSVEIYGEEPDGGPAPETSEPFALTVPGAGPWLVHFEPATRKLARSEAVLVTAPAIDVRLVCRPAVKISGHVLETGTSRLYVQWLPARDVENPHDPTTTAAVQHDGTFELHGLVAGPGRLFVRSLSDESRYALIEGLKAPPEDVGIQLRQGATLAGRVQPHAPPEGLENATLWIQAVQGDLSVSAPVEQASEFTPPEDVGTFRLRGLPPGRYDLCWQWRGAWTHDGASWTPFTNARDVDPAAGPLTLPAPR